jgi:anti-sigma-K factor RskA
VSQPTEIHTLAGAYALDALTEIERAAFARHVAACEACSVEVAELTETVSRLSAAAWEAPPPRLRDAVLAQVADTRQVTASRPDRAVPGDVRRWRRWTAAAVAAGVVALGGMATIWVVQEQRVGDARQQATQLQEEQARVSAVLAAGDVQVRTTRAIGGGQVTVAVSPRLDDGVVLLSNLPAPPEGKAYQLWLISDRSATSAGVLAAGQSSGARILDSIGGADTLGVTLEPEGGSPSPTTDVLAGVPLA